MPSAIIHAMLSVSLDLILGFFCIGEDSVLYINCQILKNQNLCKLIFCPVESSNLTRHSFSMYIAAE